MKPTKPNLHSDVLAALVGVGILIATPVLAKDHMENGDCRMMRHHGSSMMLKHFDEIDADKDGKITQGEIKAHHEARKKEADTDGDGKLSKAEFLAKSAMKAERKFSHMDKNSDGFLTEDEKPMHKHGGDHKDGHGMFEKLDTDGDGALTQEEIEAGKSRMMERMKKHHEHMQDDKPGDKPETES